MFSLTILCDEGALEGDFSTLSGGDWGCSHLETPCGIFDSSLAWRSLCCQLLWLGHLRMIAGAKQSVPSVGSLGSDSVSLHSFGPSESWGQLGF